MMNISKSIPLLMLKPGPKTLAKQKEARLSSAIRFSIALLLDASGSMGGKKSIDAQDALISFLKNIDLKENEVGLVIFGGTIRTSQLTNSSSFLERNIRSIDTGGSTPLLGAIQKGYKDVLKRANGKRVIVVATDGEPTDASKKEILDYTASIKKAGTRITTIGIGEDVDEGFLKELASSSGNYFSAKTSDRLSKIYKKVAAGIAMR